jgi:hypothetical protein
MAIARSKQSSPWIRLLLLSALAAAAAGAPGCANEDDGNVETEEDDLFGRSTKLEASVAGGLYRAVAAPTRDNPTKVGFERADLDTACVRVHGKSGDYQRWQELLMMRLERGWTTPPEGDAKAHMFGQICVGRDARLYFVGRKHQVTPTLPRGQVPPALGIDMLSGPVRIFAIGRLGDVDVDSLEDGQALARDRFILSNDISLKIHHVVDGPFMVAWKEDDRSAALELRSSHPIEEVSPTTALATVSR